MFNHIKDENNTFKNLINGEWVKTEDIINPKDLDKNSLLPDKVLRFVWDKLNPDGTADRKGNNLMDYWTSIVDDSIQIPTLSNPNQTFSAINKQKAKLEKQQHVDFLNANKSSSLPSFTK